MFVCGGRRLLFRAVLDIVTQDPILGMVRPTLLWI